ncbi:Hsp70 family protein [Mycobacterium sp. 94-17]|uniref:Hsp70 family protein n=1 Tax=Mycobacterium sp. 94-17 TaxID=2986147 RepID=UPI002D1E9952|nr:Hsp70 family protein [Mycobacterium sp. 94-17]MEB4210795.1 Hsp70 family protein [Mycobacterium sp. 94-17]
MANGVGTALGLSIGATNLAAVTADNAVTRKPVLTRYPDRPAEIGVPAENPRLRGPGVVVTGFVNRIGDPRGVVAVDGSVHRSEVLLADALRALAYTATGGRAVPDDVAVTYPAHWESPAVDALGAALGEIPEWSQRRRPILLIPDAAATLLAVRTDPGIPQRGSVAVCDFGGSGTSITLMGAGGDYRALAPTVRHRDFSGDLVDQALLGVAVANMPTTGAFPSGTAAIGSLSRLRSACRIAKEQLSSSTLATLTDGLTGTRGQVRLTRHELDDAIRPALDGVLAALEEALARNGIRDLIAVVATGGMAHLPTVTTALARHFRVTVATTPRPQLAAAVGAALRVAHGHPGETLSAPAAPALVPGRPDPEATVGTVETRKRKRLLSRRKPPRMAAVAVAVAAVLWLGVGLGLGLTGVNSPNTPAPGAPAVAPPPPVSASAGPAAPDVPVPSTSDPTPPAETETPTTTTPRATPQALPPIPGINEPIPGLGRVNQIIQEIEGNLGIGATGSLLGR